jgi:HEAT repeat protein
VIEAREQTIRIENVPERPTMVVFDDENAVLKTLTFHQPTPWLANLLHRHPNLWNRSWAIGQLASRKGDTLAGAALAHTVASADYDLTRAEAAAGLGRFPADQALPALEAAMADTSARVRMVAVEALGRIGDPRGVDAVRRAWAEDASDQVRAMALTALVRLVPDASREAITAGLRTKSYRETIQNAAIAATLQHPDSSLVVTLEAVAGDQPLPTLALAALATRGDDAARAALGRLLRDSRAWVREWAAQAKVASSSD